MSRLLVQIGQGESLVRFFVSGLAKSPKSDRISGERRAGWLISNALFAEVAKKRFWDCSKDRGGKPLRSDLTNGNANVTVGMSQSHRCRDTVKAERVAATNGGRRQLVHKMFTNTPLLFAEKMSVVK